MEVGNPNKRSLNAAGTVRKFAGVAWVTYCRLFMIFSPLGSSTPTASRWRPLIVFFSTVLSFSSCSDDTIETTRTDRQASPHRKGCHSGSNSSVIIIFFYSRYIHSQLCSHVHQIGHTKTGNTNHLTLISKIWFWTLKSEYWTLTTIMKH